MIIDIVTCMILISSWFDQDYLCAVYSQVSLGHRTRYVGYITEASLQEGNPPMIITYKKDKRAILS